MLKICVNETVPIGISENTDKNNAHIISYMYEYTYCSNKAIYQF